MVEKRGRSHRLKTALILTGGGARGAVEVGAMKIITALQKPDVIMGTSVGAINAAFYATGIQPSEMEKLWEEVTSHLIFPINWQFLYLFTKIRSLSHPYHLKRFLKRNLPVKTFEECKIPLIINATEMQTGEQVIFREGNLIDAIMASCAIPPYYPPYAIKGKEYLDGGISAVIPLQEATKLQCRQAIIINTYHELQQSSFWNIFRVMNHAMHILMQSKLNLEVELYTKNKEIKNVVMINPRVPSLIGVTNFHHTKELIQFGEQEARKRLKDIIL